MPQYNFVTVWKFEAPVARIWDVLRDPENWPSWWKGVRKVEMLQSGDADGVDAVRRFTFRSALPYDLVFDMRTVRVVPNTELAAEATGELVGTGVWRLSEEGAVTRVQYNWDVSTTKAWMNALAPIARPFFVWNHDVIMRWGGEGLSRLLGTPLIEEQHA